MIEIQEAGLDGWQNRGKTTVHGKEYIVKWNHMENGIVCAFFTEDASGVLSPENDITRAAATYALGDWSAQMTFDEYMTKLGF